MVLYKITEFLKINCSDYRKQIDNIFSSFEKLLLFENLKKNHTYVQKRSCLPYQVKRGISGKYTKWIHFSLHTR